MTREQAGARSTGEIGYPRLVLHVAGMHRLFLCLAFVLLSSCGRSPAFETVVAEIGDVRDVVPAVGTVRALSQIEVRAEASGRVIEVLARANDRVRAGQPLARIKPERLALSVEAAEAELRSAEAATNEARARAEQANRNLANRRVLADRDFISPAALNDAEAAARAANAAVRRVEADQARAAVQVRSARGSLSDVIIRSPADGFVLVRNVEQGQVVDPATETPLFVVASQLSTVLVDAQVPEPDIARITPDARIAFTVEAYPQDRFEARLREILRSPQKDRNFVSYPVILEADNPRGRLFPGMTAAVEFIHADARQVLRIPIEALYFVPKDYVPELSAELERTLRRRGLTSLEARAAAEMGTLFAAGKQRVFVLEGGRPRMRAIRVGAQSADFVEVADGLEAGQAVIVGETSVRDRR